MSYNQGNMLRTAFAILALVCVLGGIATPASSWAVNCAPASIQLDTQSDIDNFQAEHGPCDRVVGGLSIGFVDTVCENIWTGPCQLVTSEGIVNLDGLSDIRSIEGDLAILYTDISSLAGFRALTRLGGALSIQHNSNLVSLNGFSALEDVGGYLSLGPEHITDLSNGPNPELSSLEGLSSLASVGGLVISGTKLVTLDSLASLTSVAQRLLVTNNQELFNCVGLSKLIDHIDDAEPGPGPGPDGAPDVGGEIIFERNLPECNSIAGILANTPEIVINPGLNDAWYNPATSGQGFLISVLPDIQQMFVAWFTFDTKRPPETVKATVGEPGHRWLTAFGPYSGDTATLTIEVTEGGVFDAGDPPAHNDGVGDGTMTIEFADCSEALVTYEIEAPGLSGVIPIQRVASDNVQLCETLANP